MPGIKRIAGRAVALDRRDVDTDQIIPASWLKRVERTGFGPGLFSANLFAITQTLAGPRAAGKWTGLQNGFGNFAGVAAPWFTGWVVQVTGEFYLAFVVAAVIVLAGAFFFVIGIGPIKQVEFR